MSKPLAFVADAQFICAEDIHYSRQEGRMVMRATLVADGSDRGHTGITRGEKLTTGYITNIDLDRRVVETANTIYQIIPKNEIGIYQACIP